MTEIKVNKDAPRQVVRMLVDNQPNVLARISSLFGRRNFNISTITASETHIPGLTRITALLGKMMKMYCIRSLPRQKNWKWCGKSICWI